MINGYYYWNWITLELYARPYMLILAASETHSPGLAPPLSVDEHRIGYLSTLMRLVLALISCPGNF